MIVAESDVDVQPVEPSVGRAAVGEIFDDRNGLQPRKLVGEQPQHVRSVEITKRSATEEEVHLRRVRGLSQIENDRPERSQAGSARDHDDGGSVLVDGQVAARVEDLPDVTGLGVLDYRTADPTTGNRLDVKLQLPVV